MHRMEGNRIVMLDIQKNGSMVERIPGVGQDATTANTLLGVMYPNAKVAIVSVPTEALEDYEEATVARTLTGVRHNGVHYKMVGASGSAKNGKYYFCDAAHEPLLAKRFEMWPEAAITYFGILVSALKVVREEADATVFVVPDLKLGTNDCRGWIRKSLFLKLGLPEGYFYQFRLAFESTQAKGSFKVVNDDVADALGCDLIVPESSIKPGLKKQSALKTLFGSDVRAFRGPIVLGIREISRPLTFESSYTVLQHAPLDAIATEVVPQAREKIDAFKTAWRERNHQALVEMIGFFRSQRRFRGRRVPENHRSDTAGGWKWGAYQASLRSPSAGPPAGTLDLQAADRRRPRSTRIRVGRRWRSLPQQRKGHVRGRLDAARPSHYLKHFRSKSMRPLPGAHEGRSVAHAPPSCGRGRYLACSEPTSDDR